MIPHLLGPFQNYVFTDKLKARIDKLIYIYMGIDMQYDRQIGRQKQD